MDDYPGESWAGAPVFLITKGFFLLVCAELPGGQKNDIRGVTKKNFFFVPQISLKKRHWLLDTS